MAYQPAVYRQQGGDKLVVASSGNFNIESGGNATVESGGTVTVNSGGTLNIDSGGSLTFDSGALVYPTAQSVTSTGTAITATGVSILTGTTTGPVYSLTAPAAAGMCKDIIMNPSSTGATHRAVVYSGSTGRSMDIEGNNQLTLATSACVSVRLVAMTTGAWRVTGFAPIICTYSAKTT